MYAIVDHKGKQCKLAQGMELNLDKLSLEVGQILSLDDIICLHNGKDALFGEPYVKGASVKAKVLEHKRDKKIRIIHFKRRQNHLKRHGHRQDYTRVEVVSIEGPGIEKVASKEVKKTAESKEQKHQVTKKEVKKVAEKKSTKKDVPAKKEPVKKTVAKKTEAVAKKVKKSESETKGK